MKLNNLQIINIYNIIKNQYNHIDDIKTKWKVIGLFEEVFNVYQRFETEKNNIIQEYGKEDKETGQKSLDGNDKHFKELLMCETDVTPIMLDNIDDIGLSFEELMILKPIIVDK